MYKCYNWVLNKINRVKHFLSNSFHIVPVDFWKKSDCFVWFCSSLPSQWIRIFIWWSADLIVPSPLQFNIGHWFKTPVVPTEYLFWHSTFKDTTLESINWPVKSDDIIPPRMMAIGEVNLEFEVWNDCNCLVYGWIKTTIGSVNYQPTHSEIEELQHGLFWRNV